MLVTKYKYSIEEQTIETRNINEIPENTEYITFQEEVEDSEIDQYNYVPNEVALWRIRTILKTSNLEEVVTLAIEDLPEPNKTAASYVWNFGTIIERNSQTVSYIQTVLSMTDQEVDNIFIQANLIQI